MSMIKQSILPRFFCLVLLQVPKCFGLVQIFCARPKIYLHIVAVTNILCQTKRWFAFSKIGFCAGTKVFEEALNAFKFLSWLKKFGPSQNILWPIKRQGIWLVESWPGANPPEPSILLAGTAFRLTPRWTECSAAPRPGPTFRYSDCGWRSHLGL